MSTVRRPCHDENYSSLFVENSHPETFIETCVSHAPGVRGFYGSLRYEPCTQFINVSQRALHIYLSLTLSPYKVKNKTAICEQAPRSLFFFTLHGSNSQFISGAYSPKPLPRIPLNNGWGLLGLDLSSGCPWVATKKGCSVSSHISTIRPSGDRPDRRRPCSVRDGTIIVVDLITMTMSLGDILLSVELISTGILIQYTRVCTQS